MFGCGCRMGDELLEWDRRRRCEGDGDAAIGARRVGEGWWLGGET